MKKIAIIRFSSMGDIILTTPVIALLKREYPDAEIDYYIKSQYEILLRYNPNITSLRTLDPKSGFWGLAKLKRSLLKERYDMVIDLHNSFRSRYLRWGLRETKVAVISKLYIKRFLLIRFKINRYSEKEKCVILRYIGTIAKYTPTQVIPDTQLFIPSVVENHIRTIYDSANSGRRSIVIVPGAAWPIKEWPIEHMIQVCCRMIDKDFSHILIVGGKKDQPRNKTIAEALKDHCTDFTGNTGLLETAAIIKNADLVISMDTGCMHIAASFRIRMIAIFGPTVEEFGFFPRYERCVVLQRSLSCRPCTHTSLKRCPRTHFRCMTSISPDEVYDAARNLLHN